MKTSVTRGIPLRLGRMALAVCLQFFPLFYLAMLPDMQVTNTLETAYTPRTILLCVWGAFLILNAVLFFLPYGLAGSYSPACRPEYRRQTAITMLDCGIAGKLVAYPLFFWLLYVFVRDGLLISLMTLIFPFITVAVLFFLFLVVCLLFSGYVIATSLYTINGIVHLLLAKKMPVWQGVLACVLSLFPLADIAITFLLRRTAAKPEKQSIHTVLIVGLISAFIGLIVTGIVFLLAVLPIADIFLTSR